MITTANVTTPSASRSAANLANAQHSTGPRTEAGRAKSRLNALKSGLTGRTVVLPSEDAARYEQHIADWTAELKPATPRENALVQSIADSHWRAERIVSIEYSLFATGRVQFAELFAEHTATLAEQLLESHIYLTYEKQLRNLSIQEGRLRRQREKDMKALQQLQDERRTKEEESLQVARATKPAVSVAGASSQSFGFEFSDRSVTGQSTVPALPATVGNDGSKR